MRWCPKPIHTFRSLQRKSNETFLDLARHQEVVFDKWLACTKTHIFQELRQLMLVEQFKTSLPRHMEMHDMNFICQQC